MCLCSHSYVKEARGDGGADPDQHVEWTGLLEVHASRDHQGAAESQSCSLQAQHEHHLRGQTYAAVLIVSDKQVHPLWHLLSSCVYYRRFYLSSHFLCIEMQCSLAECSRRSELVKYLDCLFFVFALRVPHCPCLDPAAGKASGTAVTPTTGARGTATACQVTPSSPPLSAARRESRTNLVGSIIYLFYLCYTDKSRSFKASYWLRMRASRAMTL